MILLIESRGWGMEAAAAHVAEGFRDFTNQVLTLCSGSVVVVGVFFERFADAKWSFLAAVAVLLFLLSILLIVFAKFVFASAQLVRPSGEPTRELVFLQPSGRITLSLGVMCFFLGLVALGVFAAINLF
jgi:hypothetical protein